MSSFSLRARRPPESLHAAAGHRAPRADAQALAATLLIVALTASLAACPGRSAAPTALVIDEVVVFTARDGDPPRSACVVLSDGIASREISKSVQLRWSTDRYWVSVSRMRLKPIALGDTVSVYLGPACKAEGLVQNGGDSFAAGTGFTRLRRNSFDYVVSYHME